MKDAQHRLPPLFQKNEVLFGHDVTMALLAFESDGHGQIKIFARDGSSTRAGQGVRGSRSIRGAAEKGCPAVPVGVTNRLPSK